MIERYIHVAWPDPSYYPRCRALGGFSGRFGGYGYGHRGVGVRGTVLIAVLVLMLMGRI
jgi:hypothetical protein